VWTAKTSPELTEELSTTRQQLQEALKGQENAEKCANECKVKLEAAEFDKDKAEHRLERFIANHKGAK
jgi:hypothetical protein